MVRLKRITVCAIVYHVQCTLHTVPTLFNVECFTCCIKSFYNMHLYGIAPPYVCCKGFSALKYCRTSVAVLSLLLPFYAPCDKYSYAIILHKKINWFSMHSGKISHFVWTIPSNRLQYMDETLWSFDWKSKIHKIFYFFPEYLSDLPFFHFFNRIYQHC